MKNPYKRYSHLFPRLFFVKILKAGYWSGTLYNLAMAIAADYEYCLPRPLSVEALNLSYQSSCRPGCCGVDLSHPGCIIVNKRKFTKWLHKNMLKLMKRKSEMVTLDANWGLSSEYDLSEEFVSSDGFSALCT